MAVELTDEAPVTPLSPEKIMRDRAAATKAQAIPDEPMDAEESDVVGHPSTGFNDMANKLEKALAEVAKRGTAVAADDTSPKELKQTVGKKGPEGELPQTQVPPAEDVTEKTITSAKAADWKALKDKAKTHEAQAKDLEQKYKVVSTEYEEFRKKAGDVAVIEATAKERDAVKAERDKLKTQLETVALERSEQFSSFYQQKFDEAIKLAKESAGSEAERVEQLLALPPSKWRKEQLNAIREELSGYDQGQLDQAIREFDRARDDRESKLKDAKTNYARLQELEADKAVQAKLSMERRREAITSSVLQLAKDYESFKTSDDKDLNAEVARNEEFVKRFVAGTLDGSELATMPILAIEAKRYESKVIPALTKELAELKATLAKFQGANPNASGGARSDTISQAKSFTERFLEAYPQGNR